MKKLLVIFALLTALFCFKSSAQTVDSLPKDTIPDGRLLELSFGQKILFIPDGKIFEIKKQEAIVVPTSAILLFAQFRPDKKIRIPIFFLLPTESKQFIVDGELISERASPSLGSGFEYGLFDIPISKVSKLEFEVGAIASVLFDLNQQIRFSPLLFSRIRLQQGKNLIMFFGGSYSTSVNSYGLLFGTGTAF